MYETPPHDLRLIHACAAAGSRCEAPQPVCNVATMAQMHAVAEPVLLHSYAWSVLAGDSKQNGLATASWDLASASPVPMFMPLPLKQCTHSAHMHHLSVIQAPAVCTRHKGIQTATASTKLHRMFRSYVRLVYYMAICNPHETMQVCQRLCQCLLDLIGTSTG